ncbi:hypothetical protein [Culturomica sp.]|uniref:hypothetical protein n=1 Tax=Culturomica sp. TaxID=1926652 RepID=UPI00257B298A|nr:hypothetical protein [Culturomica sp.]
MKNEDQCKSGLLYKNFSIVLMQTFTSRYIDISEKELFRDKRSGDIDDQLFTHQERIIDRYELEGFSIRIQIDEPNVAVLEGHVQVLVAVFFDRTMQLSYRIVVPPGEGDENAVLPEEDREEREREKQKFCRISEPFNTDQLIVVAGIVQRVEHWIYNKEKCRQEIDGALKKVKITGLHLDAGGRYREKDVYEPGISFEEVQRRYRKYFDRTPEKEFYYPDHNYIYIDIWETVGHQGTVMFDRMKEDDIIQHIEKFHRSELVGLMTLYPEEWPYRMEKSFGDICGKNIAIDTDDLVLVNENVCVVIGTYGKRGNCAATNWKEHLGRRECYHVSWPEYLVLVEILLAKKQTINYVLNKYIYNSHRAMEKDFQHQDNVHDMIKENARLSVELSNIVLKLDSVRYLRYMSHKYMYHQTARNLKIEEDEKQLNMTIKQVDKSLNNVSNMLEISQANSTKYILLFISVASLFSVILQGDEVPLLTDLSQELGKQTATVLVLLTVLGVIFGFVVLLKTAVKYIAKILRLNEPGYIMLFVYLTSVFIIVLQQNTILLLSEWYAKIGRLPIIVVSVVIASVVAAGLISCIKMIVGDTSGKLRKHKSDVK